MINVEEFKTLKYDEQKEYLVTLLEALPTQFNTSKSISQLLKTHSPSASFLLSVFNQITKMEQNGINKINSEGKNNIDNYNKIIKSYDGLAKEDQKDAEDYLIKELNTI